METKTNDTIAAIATPLGEGGIGIVRLSGKESIEISARIFSSFKAKEAHFYDSHTVHYGCIKDPETLEVVDEVLLVVMREPRSYTTEDVVEINCHGGVGPIKKVLEICLSEGARLAEPGEFTKRAFLGGRIDLSQAEAVLDIIRSETDASRKIAARQLQGTLSVSVQGLRNSIIDVLSAIELAIDFSDEDVSFSPSEKIREQIKNISLSLAGLLKTADKGIILRQGASVVICGRPNVGKSSLMNALLNDNRVIVTPVAGTTRDVIEESINIGGVKVRLTDTAGIIDTDDTLEVESIKRSRQSLERADIVIFVLDSNRPLTREDETVYDVLKDKKTVIVVNKIDLERKLDISKVKKIFGGKNIIEVSAARKDGLAGLEDAVGDKLFNGEASTSEFPVITNMRHKECMMKARDAVKRASASLDEDYKPELVASDLNHAVFFLGLIIGESIEDDVLDKIFSQFCIGK